jgi:ferric-dicitrate binding protein FerR (iron transport regulator)
MNQRNKYLKIAELIASEKNGNITEEEKDFLNNWLNESHENKNIYDEIKKDNWYTSNLKAIQSYNSNKAWSNVNPRIQTINKTRRLFPILFKYVAMIILLLSVGFVLKLYVLDDEFRDQLTQPIIEPGVKGAKLIMDDGKVVSLAANENFTLIEKDGTSIEKKSGLINYAKNKIKTKKEIFNTIKTEKGEEFSLELSDGTKVKLNAESEIRFPINFIKKERSVEVKGEVYFEVSPNKKRPFIVNTEKSILKVLGTSFNIRAYSDEIVNVTTLVEGSVNVRHRYDEESTVILKPGDQASIISVNHKIKVKKVDPNYYTAWTAGKFVFKNERLEDIIRDLQRWYNFEVEYSNESLRDIRLGARIDRYTNVNKIFNIIKNTRLVNINQNENKFMIEKNY